MFFSNFIAKSFIMKLVIQILIGLIVLIHIYIVWMEMFGWTTRGPKVFRGFPEGYFEKTKVLAANQGLYNGFLVAGLVWTFFISDPAWQFNVSCFFLGCVAIAGIYGALTAAKNILYVQALPALIALSLLIITRG